MREQYITQSLIEKRFAELKAMYRDKGAQKFLDRRKDLIMGVQTREARKYLLFETISLINDPLKWRT